MMAAVERRRVRLSCPAPPGPRPWPGRRPGPLVRAGVGRRRVQTVVMMLTTLLAVTASVLAAGLVVASSAPFEHAFDRLRGAQLTANFDPAKVTEADVAATAHAAGRDRRRRALPHRVAAAPHDVGAPSSGPGGFTVPAGVDLPQITHRRPAGRRRRRRSPGPHGGALAGPGRRDRLGGRPRSRSGSATS